MAAHPNTHSGRLLYRHARLLLRVSKNELRARYAGATLGAVWAVLTPLMLLATHAAVYSLIFKVRVPGLTGLDYVLFIFSGLVPFTMTSEAVTAGLSSVLSSKSVWTNTVFPVDLAPVKAVLLSQANMVVGLAFILIGGAITGRLTWTALTLPFLWGAQVMSLIGLNWMLAMANLLFRDLQNVIGVLLMMLMVGSPIAYTTEMVPQQLRFLVELNPFAHFVHAYQAVLVLGEWPSPVNVAVVVGISLLFYSIGGFLFARSKPVILDYV
ncbi:MAG: ABC transporter permease [Deltaproteobacteria bacterium]|nr:ABC transporter permease [Deltaproteobacteria bacterium]